jgi:hypothetical protein
MDEMPLEQAEEALAEYKIMNREVEKGFQADLRKRRADEAREEKRKAKKEKGAEQTGSPSAGSGQGGFRQLPMRLAAHFAQSTQPKLGELRTCAIPPGHAAPGALQVSRAPQGLVVCFARSVRRGSLAIA